MSEKSGDIARALRRKRYEDDAKIKNILKALETGKKKYFIHKHTLSRGERKYIESNGYSCNTILNYDRRPSETFIKIDSVKLFFSRKSKYTSARTSRRNHKLLQKTIDRERMKKIMDTMEGGDLECLKLDHRLTKAERRYLRNQKYRIVFHCDGKHAVELD